MKDFYIRTDIVTHISKYNNGNSNRSYFQYEFETCLCIYVCQQWIYLVIIIEGEKCAIELESCNEIDAHCVRIIYS